MNAWILPAALAFAALCLVLLVAVLYAKRNRTDGTELGRSLAKLDKIEQSLDELNRIFLVPYKRGSAGESLLYDLLANYLPAKSYARQYRFPDGTVCDAAVFMGNYKICIDSKFPLDGLESALNEGKKSEIRKSFLKHISDIGQKYIQPAQGTLGFAMMYLPSEKLYYEAFVRDDSGLMDEALSKNVIPAGPSSLFLYIQTISYGLRGFMLSAEQSEVRQILSQIRTDLVQIQRSNDLVRNHLKNLVKAADDGQSALNRMDQSVSRLP